ncbi:MAG TPA: ATP-binding protein [Gemmataceae bacterium]|jgi:signal transduction histidine kinase|nr:ATP-binding protein [Gemmataceae bacterium]
MWDRLTFLNKGLVLISVPLLFQLAFFGLLADIQSDYARATASTIASKELLRQTGAVSRSLRELGNSLRVAVLTGDPELTDSYEHSAQQIRQDLQDLRTLVGGNAEQVAEVQALATAVDKWLAWQAETIRLVREGQRWQAIQRARAQIGGPLQDEVRRDIKTFIETSDRLDREQTAALEQTRVQQQLLPQAGLCVSIVITVLLVFVFGRSLSGRLAVLTDNVNRLAQGDQLAPPLNGRDEVAQLDRAFRHMAGEIEQATHTLERRIAERTSELAHANEALREADRRKDHFVTMLAHELRNPLAPVRNALQILKTPEVSRENAQHAREIMDRQVRHLVRLVDDLLDVSRITRGVIELRRERVDLAAILAAAVESARPTIDDRGHELIHAVVSPPILLDADPMRLSQVVSNLLVNAAKYTPAGGRIWLTGERGGSDALIRVRDSGSGIDPEFLPRVFELFSQADRSLAHSQGGLGIGLMLVRSLVELHGGMVTAESPGIGQGSEFVVRLPALPAEAVAENRETIGRFAVAGILRRVLVVDDNLDAAESSAFLLRFSGHEVEIANDGEAALRAVRDFRPDIVLLDIGLPGLSGYEVAREIRSRPDGKGVILAAVTGYGQEDDRRHAREAGFDYHLTKPLDPDTLTAFVDSPGTPVPARA